MGLEKSYPGRLRFSVQDAFRSEAVGAAGQNRLETRENRLSLAGSYSLDEKMTLAAYVPIVWKESVAVNQARQEVFGLGDVHLQARWLWIGPRQGNGSNLLGIVAGTMLPTGAVRYAQSGDPLDVQTGTGAWLGEAGLWYARFAFPWSLFASVSAQVPILHQDFLKPGTAVLPNVGGQYQITSAWAIQAALESRWADRNQEFGGVDSDSGGWMTFASPRILFSPKQDVLLQVGVQVPILERENGFHEEGMTFQGGMTYDL